jgi:hypothetical protein
MMYQQTVGVLLSGHSHGRFADIHGSSEPRDLPGIADLQSIQGLRCVGDLLTDAQVVVEIGDQSV